MLNDRLNYDDKENIMLFIGHCEESVDLCMNKSYLRNDIGNDNENYLCYLSI